MDFLFCVLGVIAVFIIVGMIIMRSSSNTDGIGASSSNPPTTEFFNPKPIDQTSKSGSEEDKK